MPCIYKRNILSQESNKSVSCRVEYVLIEICRNVQRLSVRRDDVVCGVKEVGVGIGFSSRFRIADAKTLARQRPVLLFFWIVLDCTLKSVNASA